MARPDHTPWVPGYIVLTNDDLRLKNPYNGLRLDSRRMMEILAALGSVCYLADSCIEAVKRQSRT